MKNRGIVVMLCFVLVFALVGAVEAKIKLDKECDMNPIDDGIGKMLNYVNTNSQYTQFIADSEYRSVKLVVDKTKVYYFVYNEGTGKVEQLESAGEDFTIKVTCRQMTKIVEDYNSDSPKLNRAILNRVPMKIKSNILGQCFKTPWCMDKIMGK